MNKCANDTRRRRCSHTACVSVDVCASNTYIHSICYSCAFYFIICPVDWRHTYIYNIINTYLLTLKQKLLIRKAKNLIMIYYVLYVPRNQEWSMYLYLYGAVTRASVPCRRIWKFFEFRCMSPGGTWYSSDATHLLSTLNIVRWILLLLLW